MKIDSIEFWPVRAAYEHPEISSLVARNGIVEIIIKITSDDGLVGWGESSRVADVAGVASAVRAMRPILAGRDPWNHGAILRDIRVAGGWQFQPMTANLAFAGLDMALWDLCGKSVGLPLFKLFGGAVRKDVEYFYYLHRGTEEEIAAQARDGRARGYGVYYLKVGVDPVAEEAMLAALRQAAGAETRIRVDANQSWTQPQAVEVLRRWHDRFDLDFAEAPVAIHPETRMAELKRRQPVPLCVNEGLWTEQDAIRIIQSRCGDYLCFSTYWVGTVRTFLSLCRLAAHHGWQVCKHTHGELGLAAALGQHLMLSIDNAADGHQQTAQFMRQDVLAGPLPIAEGPIWGHIEAPGLGVAVDEQKVGLMHEAYLSMGEFPVYGDRFGLA